MGQVYLIQDLSSLVGQKGSCFFYFTGSVFYQISLKLNTTAGKVTIGSYFSATKGYWLTVLLVSSHYRVSCQSESLHLGLLIVSPK